MCCFYSHFDCAPVYLNEKAIGTVLKEWIDSGKVKREDLFITTKLPPHGMECYLRIQFSFDLVELLFIDLFRKSSRISWKTFEKIIGGFEFIVRWFVSDSCSVWICWNRYRNSVPSEWWSHFGFNHRSRCRMESMCKFQKKLISPFQMSILFSFLFSNRNSKNLFAPVLSRALVFQILINVKFNVFWIMQPFSRHRCKSNYMSTYNKMNWWNFAPQTISL